jgi:aspartate carbamoyltransferase regulatory subunit
MKQLKVDAIKNGTVIDHIKPGKAYQVLKILNIRTEDEVMLGMNLLSNKTGTKKDILKIENKTFDTDQINCLALVSPSATISTIKDYEVVEKQLVHAPKQVDRIIKCANSSCITNVENLQTNFKIYTKKDITRAQCYYCEKTIKIDEIRFNLNGDA